ncbi:hypothetical protein [Amycolatopsis vastitatis]|uniref:hypothetical protein n=1 Tax=Amycolatopsis vastitatis TaxID=1905142 RepID=UPI001304631A|nr:hypothetical protein [Amycolatopsis vastitatis]
MTVAEEVADDVAVDGLRNEYQRVGSGHRLLPSRVERRPLRRERSGEFSDKGPDTLGVLRPGWTNQLVMLGHPISVPVTGYRTPGRTPDHPDGCGMIAGAAATGCNIGSHELAA